VATNTRTAALRTTTTLESSAASLLDASGGCAISLLVSADAAVGRDNADCG
jgi:hypothetical protein